MMPAVMESRCRSCRAGLWLMTEGLHGPRQLCREEGERRRGPGVGLSSTGRTLGLGPVRTVARSQGRRGGREARLGVTGTQSAFRAATMPGPSAQQCGGQGPVARPKGRLRGDKDASTAQQWAEEKERDFVTSQLQPLKSSLSTGLGRLWGQAQAAGKGALTN